MVALSVSLIFVAPQAWAGTASRAHAPITPATQWVARFEQGRTADDMAVSPDGTRVFVTGYTLANVYDFQTIAYDARTGDQLWVARFDGGGESLDFAYSVAVSPDSARVYVTGSIEPTITEWATVAYDAATGTQLWSATYAGPTESGGYPSKVVASPDGSRVFVAGWTATSSGTNYATVAYDAIAGTQLWASTYDGPGRFGDQANSVAVSRDGSTVFISGTSSGRSGYDNVATLAYDASTGVQRWVSRYHGPTGSSEIQLGMALASGSGRLFVVGCVQPLNAYSCLSADFLTLSYDARTGAQLWVETWDGPAAGNDEAIAVGVNADGTRVFVTGGTDFPENANYATVAYDGQSGALLWTAIYAGPTALPESPYALAVSPGGQTVVVTGFTDIKANDADFATIAYETETGTQLWATLYDGPVHRDDVATSVAFSPDSKLVFVAGESIEQDWDPLTIAYRP
jgi:outer membrane protein assembly factor BamB